jgi:hypothetical protein
MQASIPVLPQEKEAWGAIIIALLCSARTTVQLAQETSILLPNVRREMILMHHYGLVTPIGVRSDDHAAEMGGYYADILWDLTDHSREHSESWEGCRACNLRELLAQSI